jgi:hypothetical protein
VRKLRLALGAILILGVPAALAGAQTSVPTVAVTAAGGNITLEPSGPIAAGPTRFTYSGRGELSLATLRAGVSVDQLRRTLSRSEVAALGQVFLEAAVLPSRVVAGEPIDVQGLISQGSTNDNQVRFPRRGRYGMVCFFSEHNRLGMYRIYRVR